MKLQVLIPGMLVLMLAADTEKQEATKKEMEKLQGTWVWKTTETFGRAAPFWYPAKSFRVEGHKIVLMTDGKEVAETECTFKVDPSQKPKALDLIIKTGRKTRTTKCIYTLDGDELKICLEGVDKPEEELKRPTSFDTTGTEPYQVMTFSRKK